MPTSTPVLLTQLATYKATIDADLAEYGKKLLADSDSEFGHYSRDAMQAFVSLLNRGGKRLRGALVLASYEMFGGTDTQVAIAAARAVEMFHAYMLTIDDICDRSLLRRGDATVHIWLSDYHRRNDLHGQSDHFGLSISLCASLIGNYMAMRELSILPVPAERKMLAIDVTSRMLASTGHGQINDLFNEATRDIGEPQVRRTLTWKTAYYSFLNPLQLGAILAGAQIDQTKPLHAYSTHVGLAFQIADDILGTFGSQNKSGKSVQDDIKEGKITMLVSYALAKAAPDQKNILLAALGNADLTARDFAACKQIIRQSGALDYARNTARQQAAHAVKALDSAPETWRAKNLAFLRGLALYVADRSV